MPAAHKKKTPKKARSRPARIPRGGHWRVSLCIGGNRWKKLDWIGSHFEADYLADTYRRKCRRVAVHRDGQPPRERTAPVLPVSYRPPARDAKRAERDPETIQKLLAEFVRSNDKNTALVLNDALIEDGYDWAAFDLRDSLARDCRERRGLAERIISEVFNGSTVLEHGEWRFGVVIDARGQPRWRNDALMTPYVLIHEETPVHFRGGGRITSRKREPRLVLWSRAGRGKACRWRLYGTYPLSEFRSMANAMIIAKKDIAYEKRPRGITAVNIPDDYEPCGDCGFDHGYDYESAHAWHTANPGSFE